MLHYLNDVLNTNIYILLNETYCVASQTVKTYILRNFLQMKFDLVKIFAALYFRFAVTAKSENAFQLRQERSFNSEKDFKDASELE